MGNRKRIALVIEGGSAWLGGVEYFRNLIKSLSALPEEERCRFELFFLCGERVERSLFSDLPDFEDSLHDQLTRRIGLIRTPVYLWNWLRFRHDNTGIVRAAKRLRLDFVYPLLRTPGVSPTIRDASWIPDFQHQYMPEYFSARERAIRDRYFEKIARQATRVVFSSENARSDFHKFYPAAVHKSTVLRFCTVPDPSWFRGDVGEVRRCYSVPDKYFIICNQFWQHKNHEVVFDALNRLSVLGVSPTVVCTGSLKDYRRPAFETEIRNRLKDLSIENQVLLLGVIPRFDQIQLIRGACAVIQPSLFEGWSTVVEDARALGKTVALSDIAVHREQDPPYATFFDPLDPEALAALLKEWWGAAATESAQDREGSAGQLQSDRVKSFARQFLSIAGLE
jgi:glycosyltransferase involved in cell wall biosynthesis